MVTSSGTLREHCTSLEYKAIVVSPAVSMMEDVSQQPVSRTLWELLLTAQHLRCTDNRDQIYALLGVGRNGTANIVADYSIPAVVLMINILRNENKLNLQRASNKLKLNGHS